jgi:hypothetical protein
MRRAIQRYLPTLGPAVLVSAMSPACAAGRDPRLQVECYLKCFAGMRPQKKKNYHHWRLLKGEVQFNGMPLPVPLPICALTVERLH